MVADCCTAADIWINQTSNERCHLKIPVFFFENGMLIFEFRFDKANFYISHFLMSRWLHKRQACYGIIAITIQYVYYQTNGSVLYVLLHSIVAVAQSAMHNGIMSLLKEHLKMLMLSEFEWLKVRQFQNEFMKSLFLPKYEQKIVRISALCSEGRNLDNFLLVFWEKWWLHIFILKLTDLWLGIKGQLISEWIYEIIVSPKIGRKN